MKLPFPVTDKGSINNSVSPTVDWTECLSSFVNSTEIFFSPNSHIFWWRQVSLPKPSQGMRSGGDNPRDSSFRSVVVSAQGACRQVPGHRAGLSGRASSGSLGRHGHQLWCRVVSLPSLLCLLADTHGLCSEVGECGVGLCLAETVKRGGENWPELVGSPSFPLGPKIGLCCWHFPSMAGWEKQLLGTGVAMGDDLRSAGPCVPLQDQQSPLQSYVGSLHLWLGAGTGGRGWTFLFRNHSPGPLQDPLST